MTDTPPAAAPLPQAAPPPPPPLIDHLADPLNEILADREGNQPLKPISDGENEEMLWTWQGVIPAARWTMLYGAETVGKSTFAAWLIAQITLGTLPGEFYGKPRGVLLHTHGEDSTMQDWRPRFDASGADMSRIFPIDLSLTKPQLWRDHMKRHDVGLIYMDQIEDALGSEPDRGSTQDIRSVLREFRMKVMEPLQAATMFSIHGNKMATGTLEQQYSGNRALFSVCRQRLWLMPDQYDPDGNQPRWLCPIAANADDADPRVIALTAASVPVTYKGGRQGTKRVITKVEPIPVTGKEAQHMHVQNARKPRNLDRDKYRQAVMEILADGEWHLAASIYTKIGEVTGEPYAAGPAGNAFRKRVQTACGGLPIEDVKMKVDGMPQVPPQAHWRMKRLTADEPSQVTLLPPAPNGHGNPADIPPPPSL